MCMCVPVCMRVRMHVRAVCLHDYVAWLAMVSRMLFYVGRHRKPLKNG